MYTCPMCGSDNTREDGLVLGGRFVWVHCNSCDHDWKADNPLHDLFPY